MTEPAQWVQIQRKTFTKWANSHMRRRFGNNAPVLDKIESELESGIPVYQLINALYDTPFPKKYNKTPKMRPHLLDNCAQAVTMIEEAGIKLNFFRPDHLVDHDLKMILGMIWAIILDYQIKGISMEELSAKEGLLLWCQKKTEGYRNVKVDNFHTSFQDGLAFCALIHRHRPDLLDFDALSPEDSRGNLELAFSVAEQSLNIPRLLDVEDLVDVPRPDERSVMTYVSEYFHCFASQNQQEVAGRRIAKVVGITKSNDQLKLEYSDKSQALAAWIALTISEMEDRTFDNTLDGAKTKLNEFGDYRRSVKPEKTAELLACEQQYNNISMKLRASERPPFVPAAGTSVADLKAAWANLERAESERLAALRAELERQERLELLALRFHTKADGFEQWAATKRRLIESLEGEKFTTVGQVAARQQLLDGFDADVAAAQPRLQALEQLAGELSGDSFRDAAAVNARVAAAQELYALLSTLSGARRGVLAGEFDHQNHQEDLRKEFARQAKDFDRWLKDAAEAARDHTNFGLSLEEVTSYQGELDATEQQTTATAAERRAQLDDLDARLRAAGVTYNMYTSLSVADIEARQNTLADLLAERRRAYAAELERQQQMEEQRKHFAAQADAFVQYLADKKAQIGAVDGEPEEQIAAIAQIHSEPEGDARVAALQQLDTQMRDFGIVYNHHTKLSHPALVARWQAHKKFVANFLENLEQDAVLKQRAAQNATEWEAQQQRENLRNEFAQRAGALNRWVQSASEAASEPIAANSPEDVAALQSAFDALYAELPPKESERSGLVAYNQELVAAGITDNPLAEVSIDQLNQRFDDVVAALNQRKSDLEAEAARQAANDAMARSFAEQAVAVSGDVDAKLAQLQALSGELQQQLETLSGIQLDQSAVDALFATDAQIQEAGIRFNRHTDLTAEAVGAKWTALVDSVAEKRKLIEGELLAKSHGEVPPEQLQEIRECFAKFDKNSSGDLQRHEFKACLSALGEDISESALDVLMATHGTTSEQGSQIGLEAFTEFMINRLKDTDTEKQIVDSFKALCHDRPFITEQELRMVFRDEAELAYLLANMPKTDDGAGFDYVAYTKDIFSR